MDRLITPELVLLDADLGADARAVVPALATRVADAGRSDDAEQLTADALAREAQSATGLPGGIAIPHCRSAAVSTPTLVFARLAPAADFGAKDGGADLVFLIAAPEGAGQEHLTLLSSLARALVRAEFTDALRAAGSAEEVVGLVEEVLAPAGAPAAAAPADEPSTASTTQRTTRIVAVTACPTGIAHTYMAADALTQAGERADVDLQVETQGSAGAAALSPATIEAADAVIFATDVGVKDAARFAGKPVVVSGVKRAINEPDAMVDEAVRAATDPTAKRVDSEAAANADDTPEHAGIGLKLRQWLLTGVSYMIPFVAAGGLLIALGFLLAGYEIGSAGDPARAIFDENSLWNLPAANENALLGSGLLTYLGALLFLLGAWAFSFLVPALAGYIAYAIADRPGIAPGFVMGFLANEVGAGFLGGIVGGLIAGLIAGWIAKRPAPRWLAGLMPVVIIPLVTTIVAGMLMLLVLGRPIANATEGLTDWLNGLSGGSMILLGVLLGAMMAFDMGGPVNKAAYVFATTGLTAEAIASASGGTEVMIMAAVMIGGMVPPLALALSVALRPSLYTPAEQENGKAAWLLGAAFITEGAIPFAAADPLRVIPSMMLGSATAGAVAMAGGVTLAAPHGGIFVLFAVDQVLWFLAAVVIGTLVAAAAVTVLKQLGREREAGDFEHVYTRDAVDA